VRKKQTRPKNEIQETILIRKRRIAVRSSEAMDREIKN
jgi:hypothetical protein